MRIYVFTHDLKPGDTIRHSQNPEHSFPDITDTVVSIEMPEPPAVVAKVIVDRRIGERTVREFFWSGINATHTVTDWDRGSRTDPIAEPCTFHGWDNCGLCN